MIEVASRPRSEQTAPAAVAKALRSQILASDDGAYLGSEAELLKRLGVSTPTLRQAARLLERQQLLSVERGNGGGYFGRRPSAGATTREAALYLELKQTPLSQVRGASAPLMAEAARLAALSKDAAGHAALKSVLQGLVDLPDDADARALLALDRDATGEMLNLAANPAVELFLRVIYRLGRLHDQRLPIFEAFPERAQAWRKHAISQAAAILDGDPDLAVLLSRRGAAMTGGWIEAFERDAPPHDVDLQRLWRPTSGPVSATQMAADRLRAAILSAPIGAFLGCEEDLARDFQVSRHTVRQAAAIMRHHGLLEIKRGVKGGYVGRRPGIEQVVNSAAIYLELNNCTLLGLSVASTCLAAEGCRLAAANTDPMARDALRETSLAFADPTLSVADPQSPRSLLKAEKRFMVTMLQMAGNNPIELFVKIMYRYGATLHQPVYDHPERIDAWRKARLRAAEAILAGDGEAAGVIFGRVGGLLTSWLS